MNELAVVDKGAGWRRLALVLDSVSSPITKRVYNLGLDEFFAWYSQEPRPGFTKATVAAWPFPSTCGLRRSGSWPSRPPTMDCWAPELANVITRVKGMASKGVRLGNWLTANQAQALLNAPDTTTGKRLRDRAILAVLLGCGLRRSEVAALTFKHIPQRDGRWCIVDLVGKHGRVRTVPMPTG
jgi:integrase